MKKILTGILALTMSISLAACGGNKNSDKNTKDLLLSDHWKATSDVGSTLGITEEYNKLVFFEDGDAFFLGLPGEWKVEDGFATLNATQNIAIILDIQEEDGIPKIVIDNNMVGGLDNLTLIREKDYDKFMEKSEDTDTEAVDDAELPADEVIDENVDATVEVVE